MDSYDKLEMRIRQVLSELQKYSGDADNLKELYSGNPNGSFYAGESAAYHRAIEFIENTLKGDM